MEKMQHPSSIAVLGAGSWGTALALHLARLHQEVNLWTIESDHAAIMATEHINTRFMPGFPFPTTLHAMADLAATLKKSDDILIAVPSIGFRDTLELIKPLLTANHRIVWATKGLDAASGKLLHDVAFDVLGKNTPFAALSGPSFAKEVAEGLPTAVVVASENAAFAKDLVSRFTSPCFRVYLSTDMAGVEAGGVVKNVLAIATGISDGMGFGANARCALIARGLAEMIRLGTTLGGKQETLIGLSGLGDLVLTCTDDLSRNRRFGLALGRGKNPADAEKEIGQVVEGKHNAEQVIQLARKHHIEMPIVDMVWRILENQLTPQDAMQQLLKREPTTEN